MNKYDQQVRAQNSLINHLEDEVRRKNEELEQQRKCLQEVNFLKNRLKEKEKEVASLKQEFNRHRDIVADLQGKTSPFTMNGIPLKMGSSLPN